MRNVWLSMALIALAAPTAAAADRAAGPVDFAHDVLPLLKTRCVKCHGPAKSEAKLNLSTPGGVVRGGEEGAIVAAGKPEASRLWQRVEADEMPPDEPLPAEEKTALKRWIAEGAHGLPTLASVEAAGSDHWAFGRLVEPAVPPVRSADRARTNVDRFVLAKLEEQSLSLNPEADRATLIRRLSFDLTGLPPTPEEIQTFLSDTAADTYERMVEHYLASPHYGERWAKYWLDAAGYADSNGYFNADTDRPLAYRYRDYVVRALNQDKPFDRFVLEQFAGDELSGFVPGQDATPEIISLLEATHYLRNGQDGTGESDGNDDEVRIDRYAALEATSQIVASSLLGLTMQCAKCHDHKFEPISQRDYYQLQAVFFPAFDVSHWRKPNERFVFANLPGELAKWEAGVATANAEISTLRADFAAWIKAHRPPTTVLFHDEFDDGGPPLVDNWSNTAPGDDTPAGDAPVVLDSPQAPGALRQNGALQILESGAAGDRWLSTRQSFDWTPDAESQWIQVTFDLIDDKAGASRTPAERIGYLVALHDFNDNSPVPLGNVLFDGNPAGGVSLHLDYPGADARPVGTFGNSKYQSGHNYGVRITNVGQGKLRVEHLVDWVPDDTTFKLETVDLPDGGFGFEYCCGRSFVVDNVVVERSAPGSLDDENAKQLAETLQKQQQELAAAIKAKEAAHGEKPGKISAVFDQSENPPDVFLLERGNYGTPGEKVAPAPLTALAEQGATLNATPPPTGATSTGRRLAWARWVTQANSRQAALVARVQMNRLWQHYFGTGIVATSENLGASGAQPSHQELLDYLASQFVQFGWSLKAMHRLVVTSSAYRQVSDLQPAAFQLDPDNRLLWRYTMKRLDAESLRDAMLATGGQLDRRIGGPYAPTSRNELGEVLVDPSKPGADRRSLYLQQRRTQTLSFLNVFDSPTLVFNCIQRPVSTMPLQSLSLLNSEFAVTQAHRFAERIALDAGEASAARVKRAFLLALAHEPTPAQISSSLEFVETQRGHHAGQHGAEGATVAPEAAEQKAWSDFCQMILASNAFLYVE